MDEDAASQRHTGVAPANFDGWSIGDLRAHIEALCAEIARAEAAIAAREAQRAAAEGFFRRG